MRYIGQGRSGVASLSSAGLGWMCLLVRTNSVLSTGTCVEEIVAHLEDNGYLLRGASVKAGMERP